jgi:hypothetical protein
LTGHWLSIDDQDQILESLRFEPWELKEHLLPRPPCHLEAVEVAMDEPHDIDLILEEDSTTLMARIRHPGILDIRRKSSAILNLNIRMVNKASEFLNKLRKDIESVLFWTF